MNENYHGLNISIRRIALISVIAIATAVIPMWAMYKLLAGGRLPRQTVGLVFMVFVSVYLIVQASSALAIKVQGGKAFSLARGRLQTLGLFPQSFPVDSITDLKLATSGLNRGRADLRIVRRDGSQKSLNTLFVHDPEEAASALRGLLGLPPRAS